jgi:hypothetical protein
MDDAMVNKLMAAFFASRAALYTEELGTSVRTELPDGEVEFTFTDKNIRVVDTIQTLLKGGRVRGEIHIFSDNNVKWDMKYVGSYNPRVIPFLNRVLMMAYSEGHFFAGRGLFRFDEAPLSYLNKIEPGCANFPHFRGLEKILAGNVELGHCNYLGGFTS